MELCFYDAPFTPSIVATLYSKITHKWLLLIFYSVRISAMNAFNFEIIDWVYFGVHFVTLFIYLCEKVRKIILFAGKKTILEKFLIDK